MAYIGKTIALLGVFIFILKYLLPVIGWHPGNWLTGLGLLIIIVGAIILLIIMLIEFLFELFLLPGLIVSFILVLIFLVPFIEQVKSYAFVLKFNLIKQSEVLNAQMKPKKIIKIDAIRLRQKSKSGKI